MTYAPLGQDLTWQEQDEPVTYDMAARWSAPGRIMVTFGAENYGPIMDLAEPSLRRYAERWGFDVDFQRDLPAPEDRAYSWNRVRLALRHLRSGYKEVLLLDSDLMFVRHDVGFPWDAMRAQGASHAIVVQDVGREGIVPNWGVVGLTQAAIPMLEQMWERPNVVGQWLTNGWLEQACWMELMGYDITVRPVAAVDLPDTVYQLPQEWNVTWYNPELMDTAIIRHATGAGANFDRKLAQMREWAGLPRYGTA